MTSLSDSELLQLLAAERHDGALTQLIERYTPLVYTSALRQLNDPSSAEDVTQAVFIALWNKANRLKNPAALPAWLLSATRFACLDTIKRKTARARHEQEAYKMPRDNPRIDSAALSAILDETLAQLPTSDRAAIARRYLMGQTFQQIGALLAISPDAAKKRVSRALVRLRAHLARRGLHSPAEVLEGGLAALMVHNVPPNVASAVNAACHGNATPAVNLLSQGILINLAGSGLKATIAAAVVLGTMVVAGVGVAVTVGRAPRNFSPAATTQSTTSPSIQSAPKPAAHKYVYIGGHVPRPGAYAIVADSINLLQLINYAGGPDKGITADHAWVELAHPNGQDPATRPSVTRSTYLLSDLVAHRSKVLVQLNDEVYVLDHSPSTQK